MEELSLRCFYLLRFSRVRPFVCATISNIAMHQLAQQVVLNVPGNLCFSLLPFLDEMDALFLRYNYLIAHIRMHKCFQEGHY